MHKLTALAAPNENYHEFETKKKKKEMREKEAKAREVREGGRQQADKARGADEAMPCVLWLPTSSSMLRRRLLLLCRHDQDEKEHGEEEDERQDKQGKRWAPSP